MCQNWLSPSSHFLILCFRNLRGAESAVPISKIRPSHPLDDDRFPKTFPSEGLKVPCLSAKSGLPELLGTRRRIPRIPRIPRTPRIPRIPRIRCQKSRTGTSPTCACGQDDVSSQQTLSNYSIYLFIEDAHGDAPPPPTFVFGPLSLHFWVQVRPKLGASWGQVGPKLGLSCAKLEPSWGQVGPSWAKLGPSWGQVGATLGPSWGQVGPSWRSKG